MTIAGRAEDSHNRTAMRPFLILCALVLLPSCTTVPPAVIDRPAADWRVSATAFDRERLREWRSSFIDAIDAARAGGHSGEITAEGALLQPDSALGGGPIPNGDYRCRTIKIGAKSGGMLDYVSYPAFLCRIRQEGSVQNFIKLTGSQRQVGLIFPADAMRQVFLGTLVLGDEQGALHYGQDRDRDVAGYVERIGENRWRLLMPKPRFESKTDVLELIPQGSGS